MNETSLFEHTDETTYKWLIAKKKCFGKLVDKKVSHDDDDSHQRSADTVY